ncbi:dihydrofolate reductase family protein [Sphingomonas morindae]|uniref:Dihydrofolate reductase family protein n=1 Tax=Sphingomonas morindae TaxID=1541170 RepID=A0ABY4XDK6_9SPHN|nr:dihydrofolate reductase family protein [Sphingomonas morindae]USI74928.1 dihydrofolate reductase family protein [Sphingomonas morindae]
MTIRITCHMATSLDGRILSDRWTPKDAFGDDVFEAVHERLGGGSWLVGRVTGAEFARGEAYPDTDAAALPRTPWLPRRDADAYGIVLDAEGKIAWGRADIGGDAIVVVLTEAVTDAHLAGLRADGVGYIFAGQDRLDLAAALATLEAELGLDRLLLEGGGTVNGAFLRAGLVDEISLVLVPAVDGSGDAPSLFDAPAGSDHAAPPIGRIALTHQDQLPGGLLWLRYAVSRDA